MFFSVLISAILLAVAQSEIARTSDFKSFLQATDNSTQNKCDEYPNGVFEFPKDEKSHYMYEESWFSLVQLFTEDGTHYAAQWAFSKEYTYQTPTMHSSFILYTPEKFQYITQSIDQEIEEKDGEFYLDYGDTRASGKDEKYNFYGKVDDFTLDINIKPLKAPFLYYGDGRIDYHFGGYVQTYARSRNEVTGTLTVGDQILSVSGQGYYEHSYGRFGGIMKEGWDWFELELEDGSEILISMTRLNNFLWVIDQNCNSTEYEFEIEVLNSWGCPRSKCMYANSWSLTFDNKNYVISAVIEDGEIIEKTGIKYLIPVTISGAGTGRGFAETFGTC